MEHILGMNCILLLLSHRISTVKYCDRILVLKDKTIKASGTHEELMKTSPDYVEIFKNQITG